MSSLKQFFKSENQRELADEIEEQVGEGVHTYAIGKIESDGEASGEFMRSIMEHFEAQKGRLAIDESKYFMQLAQGLQLLGFWGQKYIINDRNTFTLEDLKKNGVKLYLLD